MATDARANAKTGIMEHKHDSFGWHWASAGHRDDGKIHKDAGADKPKFVEGTSDAQQKDYLKALNREEGFIAKIPSKAKAKDAPAATPKAEESKADDKKDGDRPAATNRERQTANSR